MAEWILRRIYPDRGAFTSLGDFREEYCEVQRSSGPFKAHLWYWRQIARSIPGFIRNKNYWRIIMIKNYLTVARRNVNKHKSFSFINILGLAIGLSCSILLMFYIHYELSFDRYHKNANEIYRIVMFQSGNNYMGTEWFNSVPGALKASLPEEFDDVLMATRAHKGNMSIFHDGVIFRESGFRFADPEFLEIFSFPLISGNPEMALTEPFTLLLTENMAAKYFGGKNPLDKALNISGRDYKITGVLKNIPKNSHFTFDFIASFNTLYRLENEPSRIDSWREASPWGMYILTRKNVDIKELENNVCGLLKKNTSLDNEDKLHLQPLTSIHLHSKVNADDPNISDIRYIYVLSAIAFIILVIACLNYVNLSTARSVKRAREVGIRKVVGAYRNNLVGQFFSESTLFVLFALIISLLSVYLLIPVFGNFTDRELNFNMLSEGWMIPGIFGIFLFVVLVSGAYPAFRLSSFNPVNVLKGAVISKSGKFSKSRNIFVVIQFTISVVLIICALTTYKQMELIKSRNLGFQKDHIIYSYAHKSLRENFQAFKHEIEKNSDITEVYGLGNLPILITNNAYPDWEGRPEEEQLYFYIARVDYNFLDFFEIELLKGRNFSKDFQTDRIEAWIINETAAKAIGWENPIGKRFGVSRSNPQGRVIGIVKDFNFNSLHHNVEPLAIYLGNPERPSGYYALKIDSEKISASLDFIHAKYKEFSTLPFEYSFLDETVNQMYLSDQRLSTIIKISTMIAVFLCCIGLFGLVAFTIEQKFKEIGIRKVFGASVSKIVFMISLEFIRLVVIGALIAFPVAWYVMNNWLENFAYKTGMDIEIFILALSIALTISFLSFGYKSYKAATANPIDMLRYE